MFVIVLQCKVVKSITMSKGSRQSLVELENLEDEIGEDEFPLGLGCALELFREKDEVEEILVSLPQISTDHVAVSSPFLLTIDCSKISMSPFAFRLVLRFCFILIHRIY